MARLTEAFLKCIGKYMLVETPLARADVCIVFGGRRAEILAAHAAQLYHQGYFGRVVVTGGVRLPDGRTEAAAMHSMLIDMGVPTEKILVDARARHTGENVLYSKELLDRTVGLENIRSVLAIGQIHGSRRFLMTLERRWPEVVKMFSAPNYFSVTRDDWHKDPLFRAGVLHEYGKIPAYKARGLIKEISPAALNRAIAKLGARPKPPQP